MTAGRIAFDPQLPWLWLFIIAAGAALFWLGYTLRGGKAPVSRALGLTLIVVACTSPTSSCGCSPVPPSVEAVGTVRTVAGVPVTTAILSVAGTLGNCSVTGSRVTFSSLGYSIDATGKYRALIIPSEPDSICVKITARRDANAGADSVVSSGFSFAVGRLPRPDTVVVNLTFP